MASPRGPHPWDVVAPPDFEPDSSDDEITPEQSPAKAAFELLSFLIGLYASSQISAASFCTICYYAELCGVAHVSEYSQPPGKQTGYYQRFLNKAFGFDHMKKHFYQLHMPGSSYSGQAGRFDLKLPIRPHMKPLSNYWRKLKT